MKSDTLQPRKKNDKLKMQAQSSPITITFPKQPCKTLECTEGCQPNTPARG